MIGHRTRAQSLIKTGEGLLRGGRLSLTHLGRHGGGGAYAKHNLKAVDRLLGNAHLHTERKRACRAMAKTLSSGLARPVGETHRRATAQPTAKARARCDWIGSLWFGGELTVRGTRANAAACRGLNSRATRRSGLHRALRGSRTPPLGQLGELRFLLRGSPPTCATIAAQRCADCLVTRPTRRLRPRHQPLHARPARRHRPPSCALALVGR